MSRLTLTALMSKSERKKEEEECYIRTVLDTLQCLHFGSSLLLRLRDCKGLSKLPLIENIIPYKISCICGSSDIPLLSLASPLGSHSPG